MRKDLYTNGSVDLPKITKGRSFFDLSHSSHIDLCVGSLFPIDQVIEIIPGDTFDYSHRLNIRMTNPPKVPVMDQLVFDIYFFYVPNRIVWDTWDKFITNNNTTNYNTSLSFHFPIVDVANSNLSSYLSLNHSILDYLGYNALDAKGSNIASYNPSLLPVRGYYAIWNEYFRYEPLQHPIYMDTDSTDAAYQLLLQSGMSYYDSFDDQASRWSLSASYKYYNFCLAPVNRLPGYFSRSLPTPVNTTDVKILNTLTIGSVTTINSSGSTITGALATGATGLTAGGTNASFRSMNLSGDDNSIRALSNAFALNKFLYIDNVYGKRITEWTYGHFGVNVPDSRVQRPEFLAKKRIYINVNQIMQSSSTDSTSPQGNAGAWSQTFDASHDFTKSFVEYGYLFALGCIRVLNHSYSSGISKHWSYRTRFDYYLPEFNNVGDQPVYTKEIELNPSSDTIWGYQERFAQYKMIPSRVAGFCRPTISGSLAIWNYSESYNGIGIYLSATWMFEPTQNINRTLYISQAVSPSFILDYVADIKAYRSMPYHSIPGGLTGSY